jgi:hypothetical protein
MHEYEGVKSVVSFYSTCCCLQGSTVIVYIMLIMHRLHKDDR